MFDAHMKEHQSQVSRGVSDVQRKTGESFRVKKNKIEQIKNVSVQEENSQMEQKQEKEEQAVEEAMRESMVVVEEISRFLK